MRTIGHPVGETELFALSLLPSVAAGMASWLLTERRFVAAKRPLSGGVAPGRAASPA
jgi:hypothetical protein